MSMTVWIKLLRPHQWLKNAFVLAGLLFSHGWNQPLQVQLAVLAFLAFCLIASTVYVLNDLADVESDRRHPTKCRRPIASGAVPPAAAGVVALGLLGSGLTLGWLANPLVCVFLLAYLLLNVLYSWKLKHMVLLDVFSISAGFMLRIFAGTTGIGIAPSHWLLICGLMVTLFLGFAKRRAELLRLPPSESGPAITRKVLDHYAPEMLDKFIGISAACVIMTYSLYTVSPDTIRTHHSANLIYTLPFVIYGLFRYVFLLHREGSGDDTARDLLTDKHLLLTSVGWLVSTFWILH